MSNLDSSMVIAVLVRRLQLLGGKTDVSPFDVLDVEGMHLEIQPLDTGGVSIHLDRRPEPS